MNVFLVVILSFSWGIISAQNVDTLKKSIPKKTELKIGRAQFRISYYAPNVRGRIIYGGLVPFNEVWVTGAHSATSFEFNVPITLGGKEIEAGKYAFFTIPNQDSWTIIINKNYKQHLTDDYSESEDVHRFTIIPTRGAMRERLDYRLEKATERELKFVFRWEQLVISFPITIQSNKPVFKMDE